MGDTVNGYRVITEFSLDGYACRVFLNLKGEVNSELTEILSVRPVNIVIEIPYAESVELTFAEANVLREALSTALERAGF